MKGDGAGEPEDPEPVVPTDGSNLQGFTLAMPMLEGFQVMERLWALGRFDGFRQKQGYTQIYPGSPPRRVKTYILLV
jgi:hypothetical protein